jgi:hypothetical protein
MGFSLGVKFERLDTPGFFILAVLLSLILFGKNFSNIRLSGFIYLHDLLLGAFGSFCLIWYQPKLRLNYINSIAFLSIVYLLFSLIFRNITRELERISYEMILRQFAIFYYLIFYYLIFCSMSDYSRLRLQNWLPLCGGLAFLVELFYCLNIIVANQFSHVSEFHFYFSPAAVMGLFVFAAWVYLSSLRVIVKLTLQLITVGALFLTGHLSAVLAFAVILLFFLIIRIGGRKKYVVLSFILLAFAIILIMPSIFDFNLLWRVNFWKKSLENLWTNNWAILGEGFGTIYGDYFLFADTPNPREPYLSPPHNSFITICHHIGLLPGLLLFLPYRNIFNSSNKFIAASLVALTCWSFFNVILELPQTAAFFWVFYFSFATNGVEFGKANPNTISR